MKLTFQVGDTSQNHSLAVTEYEKIWAELGDDIVRAYEQIGGYPFPQKQSIASIYNGISQSHPLKFQAHKDHDLKVGDLIHELGHVYIVDGESSIPFDEEYGDRNTRSHKKLFLLLYDVLVAVCGEQFADREVEREREFASAYDEAWTWALKMTADQRKAKFAETIKK